MDLSRAMWLTSRWRPAKESNHLIWHRLENMTTPFRRKSAGLPQLTVRGPQFFIGWSDKPSWVFAPSSKRAWSPPAEGRTFCYTASNEWEEIFPFKASHLLYFMFLDWVSYNDGKGYHFCHIAPKEWVVDVNCCRFCLMSFVRAPIVHVWAKGHSCRHVCIGL